MTKHSLIYMLLLTGTVAACGSPPKDTAQKPPVPVLAIDVADSAGGRSLSIGTVRGTNNHELAAEYGGRVVALYANVGDRVSRGQVLARLDPAVFRVAVDQAQANLNQAKAALAEARSNTTRINGFAVDQARASLGQAQAAFVEAQGNADRIIGLTEAGVASQSEREKAISAAAQAQQQVKAAQAFVASQVERETASTSAAQAQQQVMAAEAQLRLAQRNLSLTTIVAPTSGVIAARHANLSGLVQPGAVLFSIDGEGSLEIEARIPGLLANAIKPGQVLSYRFGAQTGQAKLIGFSTRAEGVDVRLARLAIVEGKPAAGVAVELVLPTGQSTKEAVSTIPMSAVFADRARGGNRVLAITPDGKLQSIPVEILEVTSLGADVRGDLAGKKIVAAGPANLSLDRPVRPVPYTF